MTLHIVTDSSPPTIMLTSCSRFVVEVADVADLSRRLDASDRDRVGLLAALETVRAERDRLRAELEGRVPAVAAVEWFGWELRIDGSAVAAVFASIALPGQWYIYRPEQPKCWATSEDSARKLAELLANHDPGGVWRVNGDVVSPETVRMVCPSVAVTWGEA